MTRRRHPRLNKEAKAWLSEMGRLGGKSKSEKKLIAIKANLVKAQKAKAKKVKLNEV